MPTINSISLDLEEWELHQESGDCIVWRSKIFDVLVLNFFSIPPDIPFGFSEVEELRDFYASAAQQGGGRLVELEVGMVAQLDAIKTIFKFPHPQGHGLVYQGSWTLPLAEFSYVIKVQCPERGTTGIREAIIMDAALKKLSGEELNEEKLKELAARVSIESDDERYDAMFPDHPLSRTRQYLNHIRQSLEAGQELLTAEKFRR